MLHTLSSTYVVRVILRFHPLGEIKEYQLSCCLVSYLNLFLLHKFLVSVNESNTRRDACVTVCVCVGTIQCFKQLLLKLYVIIYS